MIIHTFFDKSNTITSNSKVNQGLNPICELNYGQTLSRFLFHFNTDKIEKLINEKIFPDINKIKHTLRMFNCGSLNLSKEDVSLNNKIRSSSFDIIFFLLPQDWDGGKGFNASNDFYTNSKTRIVESPSNWYQAKNGFKWSNEGVFTTSQLMTEFEKFNEGENSIIFHVAHFDVGDTNIEFDITDIVNSFIKKEKHNYGIGVAFAPYLENADINHSEYVGFFSPWTNTFFEPYIESYYDENIPDCRFNFISNQDNFLFFNAIFNGEICNLDELPICTINEVEYEVKQASKGQYYAIVNIDSNVEKIENDIWSNIKVNGSIIPDCVQEFLIKPLGLTFTNNYELPKQNNIKPFLNGISFNEKVNQGDIRRINVNFRKMYTSDTSELLSNSIYYRVYVKENNKEIDVFSYAPISFFGLSNYFLVDTNSLIPNTYHVDIKVISNLETKIFKDTLMFNIVNNVTNSIK